MCVILVGGINLIVVFEGKLVILNLLKEFVGGVLVFMVFNIWVLFGNVIFFFFLFLLVCFLGFLVILLSC